VLAPEIQRPEPAPPVGPLLVALIAVGLAIYVLLGALALIQASGGGSLAFALLGAFAACLVAAALGVARLVPHHRRKGDPS
jgi:hypothetical protein